VDLEADLSVPLSPQGRSALVDLVDEFGIVIVRGQRFTMEEQRRVMEPLGRIEEYDLLYVAPDDGVLNADRMAFHSDFAYAHTPYKYLSLHAVDVVAGESSTYFANGRLAYERLSSAQRKLLASLTTTAVSVDLNQRSAGYDLPAEGPAAIRAAVIYHPRTARPILYVNEGQHARFNELDRTRSDALFAELFEVLYRSDAILTHVWSPGDILIWDNLSLQHGRSAIPKSARRRLQRVSVADVGGADMLPGFLKLDL
jgi:alpha-ketoglutarate-dependent taurine dioxygenase